ncbi:CMP/dCMP-type deaminase domain-containing protein [Trichostrongylus colubriformis]|uniref:CMP/dCMP-type deaminase domain-containing protein n=1 Tax=Trichostrongylus colubriformis TaxID=6319 RepID=A0AAN8F4S2_TRICO
MQITRHFAPVEDRSSSMIAALIDATTADAELRVMAKIFEISTNVFLAVVTDIGEPIPSVYAEPLRDRKWVRKVANFCARKADLPMKHTQLSFEDGEEPARKCARMEIPEARRIVPILSNEIRGETVPLTEFYVVHFQDKRKINTFLKNLPLVFDGFDHLKRVDKLGRVLVQPAINSLSDKHLTVLRELELGQSDVQIVKVPASKPRTTRQFNWAKEYWPISFHPDKELENLLNNTFLSDEEKIAVYKWSEQAFEVGCVVVQDNKELVRGSRTERLLGHPVMDMVQKLAKCQRRDEDYLATGCDVYVKDEPCAMCAMALVHCRASRVFYCRTTRNGVLAPGKWQLHLEPAINHHYGVFHVKIADEDDQLSICGS